MYSLYFELILISCFGMSTQSSHEDSLRPILLASEQVDSTQRMMLFDDSGLLRAVQNIPRDTLLDISLSCQAGCPHDLRLQRTDGLQAPVQGIVADGQQTAQFHDVGRGTWKIAGAPGENVLKVELLLVHRSTTSSETTSTLNDHTPAARPVEGSHEISRESAETGGHHAY